MALVLVIAGMGATTGIAGAAERCTQATNVCASLTAAPNPVATSSASTPSYFSFVAKITNRGNAAAGQTQLTGDLSGVRDDAAFHSGSAGGGCTYAQATEKVTCNITALGSGQSTEFRVVMRSPSTEGAVGVADGAFVLSVNERTRDNPTSDPRPDTVGLEGASTEAKNFSGFTWVPEFTEVSILTDGPFDKAPSCVVDETGKCEPGATANALLEGSTPTTTTRSSPIAGVDAPDVAGVDDDALQWGRATIPSNTGNYAARFLECAMGGTDTQTSCADVVSACPFLPGDTYYPNCLRQGVTWDAQIAFAGNPRVNCNPNTTPSFSCAAPMKFELYWDDALVSSDQTSLNFALFHFEPSGQIGTTPMRPVTRRCSSATPTTTEIQDRGSCLWKPRLDATSGFWTVTYWTNQNGRMR